MDAYDIYCERLEAYSGELFRELFPFCAKGE